MIENTVVLTRGRVLKIFWSHAWRAALVVLGFMMINFAIGWVLASIVGPQTTSELTLPSLAVSLTMMGAYAYAQVLALRMALACKWSDFELIPISRDGRPVELTAWRTLKVFWSYGWRASIAMVAVLAVVATITSVQYLMNAQTSPIYLAIALLVILTGVPFGLLTAFRNGLAARWSDFTLEPIARNQSGFGTSS